MNFTLISPDEQGQKWRTKFQEPVVLPPDAKISFNFGSFERKGHYDYRDPQSVDFLTNINGISQIVPRLSMVSTNATGSPDNVEAETPINPVPNTDIPAEDSEAYEDKEILIPADVYNITSLKDALFTNMYKKGYFGVNSNPKGAIDYYGGINKLPTVVPFNGGIFPYQQQFFPNNKNEMLFTFGALKADYVKKTTTAPGTDRTVQLSTSHLKNAINTEAVAGTTVNSYKPSVDTLTGNYESYALSRHRIIHLGSDIELSAFDAIQAGNDMPRFVNKSFEGMEIPVSKGQFLQTVAQTRQDFSTNSWTGKDFFGLYSIDYAGLANENHTSLTPGGTNGQGFSPSTHPCRKGRRYQHATHKPPSNQVISENNFTLTTNQIGFNNLPKCFFGIELGEDSTGASPTVSMDIFMTTSCDKAWRDNNAGIDDLVLVKSIKDIEVIPGYDGEHGDLGTAPFYVAIHMVEKYNLQGRPVFQNMDPDSQDPILFPTVWISGATEGTWTCVFDGRFRNFPGILHRGKPLECGFTSKFLCEDASVGAGENLRTFAALKTDEIAWRGSDLPFAPIYSSSHQVGGWQSMTQAKYSPQSGIQNNKTNPLNPNYIMRQFKPVVSAGLAADVFNMISGNEGEDERGERLQLSLPTFPHAVNSAGLDFFLHPDESKSFIPKGILYQLKTLPRNFKNDKLAIYINLPIKAFANVSDGSKPGYRKQMLTVCPSVFGGPDVDDDAGKTIDGSVIITGGYAPSIGITHPLNNNHIITTNYFEIDIRNLLDDEPALQLHKSIINFSVFQ